MPRGEVDLVCYIAWMLGEGSVGVSSIAQYLSGVRLFCENEKMVPSPPTPSQSQLIQDALRAARRFESTYPVKEVWRRAGISAKQSLEVLRFSPGATTFSLRRRKAIWQVAFCFSFRGGTVGALWPQDFTFESDFRMSIKPEVLKRTNTDCTRNPRRRFYSVPQGTPIEDNPIAFVWSFVGEAASAFGYSRYMFAPDRDSAGGPDFITTEIVAMANVVGFQLPAGMRFTLHSPRRGILTEFILQHPRPDPLVIRRRMGWESDNTVVYFCRDVMRSAASAIYVPGALQVDTESNVE